MLDASTYRLLRRNITIHHLIISIRVLLFLIIIVTIESIDWPLFTQLSFVNFSRAQVSNNYARTCIFFYSKIWPEIKKKEGGEINRKTKKKKGAINHFRSARRELVCDAMRAHGKGGFYTWRFIKSALCAREVTYDDDNDDSCRFESARKINDIFSPCFFEIRIVSDLEDKDTSLRSYIFR